MTDPVEYVDLEELKQTAADSGTSLEYRGELTREQKLSFFGDLDVL